MLILSIIPVLILLVIMSRPLDKDKGGASTSVFGQNGNRPAAVEVLE